MFDSTEDLIDKIRLGEDTYFAGGRVSVPSREDLADELAAFANARGGVCVLGVKDKTREVLGIPLELLDGVGGGGVEDRDPAQPVRTLESGWLPAPRWKQQAQDVAGVSGTAVSAAQ